MFKKKEKVMDEVKKEELEGEIQENPETEDQKDPSEETPQNPPKKKLSKWVKIGIGAAIATVGVIVGEVVNAVKGRTSDDPEGEDEGSEGESGDSETEDEGSEE